jgi:hypothetical protein
MAQVDADLSRATASLAARERRRAQLAEVQKRAFAEALGQREAVPFFASIRGEDGRRSSWKSERRSHMMAKIQQLRIAELERAGMGYDAIAVEIMGPCEGREDLKS